ANLLPSATNPPFFSPFGGGLRPTGAYPAPGQWMLAPASVSGNPGKTQNDWIRAAVLDRNSKAESALALYAMTADAAGKARLQEQFARCVIKGLRTRDNSLWKYYTALRKVPTIGDLLPVWRQPATTREAAANWLSIQFLAAGSNHASRLLLPGLDQ